MEKVQSIPRQELNRDNQKVQHRDTEYSNISERDRTNQIEFIEIINGTSGEFVEEKLHQERYNSFGLRDAHTGNKSNREEYSGIGKSTNKNIETELTINEPKLNATPHSQASKTKIQNQEREINYDKGRSR